MTKRYLLALAIIGLAAGSAAPVAGSAATALRFPIGTFLTKITAADLYAAGLDVNDAHWERVTYRADGTWEDVWFHPTVRDQPPAHGRYLVRGDTLRVLGTPDTVRWHYSAGMLRFSVVHVSDRLARLIYTAHAWRRVR